jgi:hypothetical protein
MRRLCLLLLLTLLALPTLALAARSKPNDGSLVITNANGTVTLQGSGLVFGQFDHGTLTVIDYEPEKHAAPTVSGARMKPLTSASLNVVYVGSNVRFLFPGGKYVLRFDGVGIDLSVVGKGTVQVAGKGTVDDGSVSVNGAKPQDMTPFLSSASYGSLVGGGFSSGILEKVPSTTDKVTATSSRFS